MKKEKAKMIKAWAVIYKTNEIERVNGCFNIFVSKESANRMVDDINYKVAPVWITLDQIKGEA